MNSNRQESGGGLPDKDRFTVLVSSASSPGIQLASSSPQLLAHLTSPRQALRLPATATLAVHFPYSTASLSASAGFPRLVYNQQPISFASQPSSLPGSALSSPANRMPVVASTSDGNEGCTGAIRGPLTLTAGRRVALPPTPGSIRPVVLTTSSNARQAQWLTRTANIGAEFMRSTPSCTSTGTVLHPPLTYMASGSTDATIHHMGAQKTGTTPTLSSKDLSFACIKGQLQRGKPLNVESSQTGSEVGRDATSSMIEDVPPSKRIKIEQEGADGVGLVPYSALYVADRVHEMEMVRSSHEEHQAELFFLEKGGNFMDYFAWRKRPNAVLANVLQSKRLDGGEASEVKSINNEVKVLTMTGGTVPLVTPIAISTTLPPAVTAMQQHQQQQQQRTLEESRLTLRKIGGRHGMVYGCVSPKATVQHPQWPGGIPLSSTLATTTIGAPPPYTSSCSMGATTFTAASTIRHAGVNICTSNVGSFRSNASTSSLTPEECIADVGSSSATQEEALVEMAKQEAQALLRVAELRKAGMWSQRRLPKVQEPLRNKSHWDYLLDEMQWMAVDFAQERRWKISAAKKMADTVVKYHSVCDVLRRERQEVEKTEMMRTAGFIAGIVSDFWLEMRKMALHNHHKDVEAEHAKLVEMISDEQQDICSQPHPYQEDDDEEEDDELSVDEETIKDEIADLIKEGEMPLDKLVEKYASGYDKELHEKTRLYHSSVEEDSDVEMTAVEQNAFASGDTLLLLSYMEVADVVRLASSLQPTTTVQNTSLKMAVPSLIKRSLRGYQRIALEWIKSLHANNLGGILYDERGLGKKVEIISFFAHLATSSSSSSKGSTADWGLHLIVASTGTIFSWLKELSTCCPALKVLLHCGSAKDCQKKIKCWPNASLYNVCLTTYKCLLHDLQHFKSLAWKCIVFSEVEKLTSSEMVDALLTLNCSHCYLLANKSLVNTDSPSHLLKLVSLVWPIQWRSRMQSSLLPSSNKANDSAALESLNCQLQQIFGAISLGRLKIAVHDQLPPISDSLISCSLTNRQSSIYSDIMSQTRTRKILRDGRLRDVLELLIRLKRVCNHADLLCSRDDRSSLLVDDLEFNAPRIVHNLYTGPWLSKELEAAKFLDLVGLELQPMDSSVVMIRGARSKPLIVDLDICNNSLFDKNSDFLLDVTGCGLAALSDYNAATSSLLTSDGSMSTSDTYTECSPLYGEKFRQFLSQIKFNTTENEDRLRWNGLGSILCSGNNGNISTTADSHSASQFTTDCLQHLTGLTVQFGRNQKLLNRLKVALPAVVASCSPATDQKRLNFECEPLKKYLATSSCSQPVLLSTNIHLLQADSGKLRSLLELLKRLQLESRRVLIMSHMSAMLDLVEMFSDHHSFTYLRLDALATASQRLFVTRRFNSDKRYMCLMTSTRVSVNGIDRPDVDTIITLDTDWSPSMRNTVQEFVWFIGQQKEVHVYRFVCEGTVEQNLFKMYGSGRGACYSDPLLQTIGSSDSRPRYSPDLLTRLFSNSVLSGELLIDVSDTTLEQSSLPDGQILDVERLEKILYLAEERQDAYAAHLIDAEKELELEEFTNMDMLDTAVLHHIDDKSANDNNSSIVLSEIEQYAISLIDYQTKSFTVDIPDTESLTNLIPEGRAPVSHTVRKHFIHFVDENDDVMLSTYPASREAKQAFVCEATGEHMPIWAPPTPPHDDGDIYIDQTSCFLYERSAMSESQLPPVYIKKGHKKLKVATSHESKNQVQREEQTTPTVMPRSLFDCPQLVLRYDSRLIKTGQSVGAGAQVKSFKVIGPGQPSAGMLVRPEQPPQPDHPDWLIHEDWALLQAFQMCLELPMKQMTSSSAFIPNWELISDVINTCSRAYRSAKQAKNRYENFILPREEGKMLHETSPRKLKKSCKGLFKAKGNRAMKTNQMFIQDNNKTMTTMFVLHFDSIKSIAAKRTPTVRPSLAAPGISKNTKHTVVIQESGIVYDQPMSPIQVAAIRADRIAKQKLATPGTPAPAGVEQQQQQQQQQQLPQHQQQLAQQLQQQRAAAAHQQQAVAAAAAGTQLVLQTGQQTGQILLQPGQQLVAGSQQHITAAGIDNRHPAQMTFVQAGVPTGASTILQQQQQAANQHKMTINAGALAAAAAGMATGRGLPMPGTSGIVVNTGGAMAPQTYSLNKVQVSSTGALLNTAGLAQTVRAVRHVLPFNLKDATSVVNQVTGVTLATISDASRAGVAQVITATTLTPGSTQLVVAQQRGGMTVSQLHQGAVQPQLLGQIGATKPAASLQQLQLRQRQPTAVFPQLRPTQIGTVQQFPQGSIPASALQKTNIITSLSQAQLTQMAKMTAQQPKMMSTGVGQRAVVQQIQVSKGQLLQQQHLVPGGLGAQTVATLIKTVSSTSGVIGANVSIPMGSVNLGIPVNIAGHKFITGKAVGVSPQQIRQFQVQTRATSAMVLQSVGPQKGTALHAVSRAAATSGSQVILQPQQQKVVVQPMSQLLKQQQQQQVQLQLQQGQQIHHHVIASSSAASVIATQIVSHAAASATGGSSQGSVPKAVSVTITTSASLPATTTGTQVVLSSLMMAPSSSGSTIAATVKLLAPMQPTGVASTTIVRPEMISTLQRVSSSSSLSTPPAGAPQSITLRPGMVQTGTPHITMTTTGVNRSTVSSMSQSVHQAVQEVVLAAQAQARQAPSISFTTAILPQQPVGATTIQQRMAVSSTVAPSAVTTPPPTVASLAPPVLLTASPTAAAAAVTAATLAAGAGGDGQQQGGPGTDKSSPYQTRLRNQRL